MKALNCTEGKTAGNRWTESESKIMVAEIGVVLKDNLVSEYEEKINLIQDELDYFNQVTEI